MVVDLSKKAQAFLLELRFAVLATVNQDGTPQLTTMWYLLEDGGTILMQDQFSKETRMSLLLKPERIIEYFE